MIPSFMRLIITRTVAKETNNNMILQQVYFAIPHPPFEKNKIYNGWARRGLCASDVCVFWRNAANKDEMLWQSSETKNVVSFTEPI